MNFTKHFIRLHTANQQRTVGDVEKSKEFMHKRCKIVRLVVCVIVHCSGKGINNLLILFPQQSLVCCERIL